MPCYDGVGRNNIDYEAERRAKKRLDSATAAACEACGRLDALGYLGKLSDKTRKWYLAHKAEDAERLAAEADAKKARLARKKALAKLSPEERQVLGLNKKGL